MEQKLKQNNAEALEWEQGAALTEQAEGFEVVEKREECAKHYHLGGNRYQAVLFAEPVHFQEEGKKGWQEYDNNLEKAEDHRGRRVLRNKANPLQVELPEQADAEALVKLTHKGRTLSWMFAQPVAAIKARVKQGEDLQKERMVKRAQQAARFVGRTAGSLQAMAVGDLAREVQTAQERRADLTKLQAQAEYENVLPGVSVRYHLEGAKIKEDIILADAAALKRASLILPDEYDYAVNDDQSVSVQDKETQEELFHFEPPVVYDSAEAPRRTLATVALSPVQGGMGLSYQIEDGFLNDAVFPVVIDPVVRRTSDKMNIRDIWMGSKGEVSETSSDTLKSGISGGTEYVSLMNLQKLAKITNSDTIIQAVLQLYCRSAATTTNHFVEVHQLRKPWAASSANWTTFDPDDSEYVDPNAADYAKPSEGAFFTMDITNMYRDWYRKDANGNSLNNGLLLRKPVSEKTDPNYVTMGSSEIESTGSSFRPMIYVNYVSHAGVQGWWSYESQSIGRGGTAYVDRFNGNLIYEHSDTRMTGNLLPVSVTHYYNSCMSGEYGDKNPDYYHCGYGWKMSVQQRLDQQDINGVNHFAWTDGSGTRHWFEDKGNGNKSKDLEGMGYTLIKYAQTSSLPIRVEIQDQSGVIYRFQKRPALSPTYQWKKFWLVKIKNVQDISGDKKTAQVSFDYETANSDAGMEALAGKLLKITDPAKRETLFEYKNNGMLSKITAPGPNVKGVATTRVTEFGYDTSARLTSIVYKYDGGKETKFDYGTSSTSHLLREVTNFDQTKLNISYESLSDYFSGDYVDSDESGTLIDADADEQMLRVKSLEYIGKNDQRGAKQLFNYRHMRTEVTAVDGVSGDAGKVLTYQFSDAGAVVAVHDELGYAQFNKFGSKTEASPEDVSRLRKVVINRLRVPHFDDANWHYTNSARATNERCMGMRSLKVESNGSCYQEVALEAGDWSFSCYAKVDSATGGASIGAQAGTNAATSVVLSKQTPAGEDTTSATAGWERLHAMIHLDSAATVKFTLQNSTGTAYFACPQVEEGKVPNSVNLLSNTDFRATGNDLPLDWEAGTLESTDQIVSLAGAPTHIKGKAMHMVGKPSRTDKTMKQLLYISGSKGDTFVVGGWANGKSVPNLSGVTRSFSVGMRFLISKDNWSDDVYKAFNAEWVGWQYGCHVIKAPVDYLRVEFFFSYGRNCNEADFTNLFLYREPFGQSFAYDDKRRVTSIVNRAGQKADMEYDSYDNLTSYRQPGRASGDTYTMTYGSAAADKERKLVRTKTTPMKLQYTYAYDDHGNQKAEKISYGSDSIKTATEFTDNGNYTQASYDARGQKTTYDVDLPTGQVNSVTLPGRAAIDYTYVEMDRIKTVSSNGSQNKYIYENDHLQKVQHNTDTSALDVEYTFAYDDLGRQTTVKAGAQTLTTNSYYDDRSHLLKKVQYGNAQEVSYQYDDFDRLTGMTLGGQSYTYEYGANGRLAMVKDAGLNRSQWTEFDLSDRPIQKTTRDDATGATLYRTSLRYDKFNNLSAFLEQVGEQAFTTTYAYDKDNRPTSVAFGSDSYKVGLDYKDSEKLNRLWKRTVTNAGTNYVTTYAYKAPDGETAKVGTQTNVVESISRSTTGKGLDFSYQYNADGSIQSEKRGDKGSSAIKPVTYEYDLLGQLTRVNDPNDATAGSAGTTWVYAYDLGGNIKEKNAYSYTTGTVSGVASSSMSFAYDSSWKDKLYSINGQRIQSDAIGNTTNDGVWSYTWRAGRQLAGMSKSGTTISYAYDADGLRTRKTVNGTATEYTMHGKLLTHLKKGNDQLHFYYDEQSQPAMVNYNGTVYTYVHDLQGDIVGIVDSNGNPMVEYWYDAWGKPLKTTGSLITTLGALNPFRYRGYIYDEETGLYYLRSRYYNPEWSRFILGDTNLQLDSPNIYAYCENSAINFTDPDGHRAKVIVYLDSEGNEIAIGYYHIPSRYKGIVKGIINLVDTLRSVIKLATKGAKTAIKLTPKQLAKHGGRVAKRRVKEGFQFLKELGSGIKDMVIDYFADDRYDISIGRVVSDIIFGVEGWTTKPYDPDDPLLNVFENEVDFKELVPEPGPAPSMIPEPTPDPSQRN